jgi:hypothetical protein
MKQGGFISFYCSLFMQKSQNTQLVCITFPNAATYTQQSTENIRATFGLNWMNGEGWVDVFACTKDWRVKEKIYIQSDKIGEEVRC